MADRPSSSGRAKPEPSLRERSSLSNITNLPQSTSIAQRPYRSQELHSGMPPSSTTTSVSPYVEPDHNPNIPDHFAPEFRWKRYVNHDDIDYQIYSRHEDELMAVMDSVKPYFESSSIQIITIHKAWHEPDWHPHLHPKILAIVMGEKDSSRWQTIDVPIRAVIRSKWEAAGIVPPPIRYIISTCELLCQERSIGTRSTRFPKCRPRIKDRGRVKASTRKAHSGAWTRIITRTTIILRNVS